MSLIRDHLKCLVLPTAILSLFVFYDVWFLRHGASGRDPQLYIADIWRINEYCNWYLGFTAVMIGLLAAKREDVRKDVGTLSLSPFVVTLIAASINLVFFPVPYSVEILWPLKLLWLYHVILEQAIVIFTCYGILRLGSQLFSCPKTEDHASPNQ